jgi:hypothetical protein
MAELRNGKEKAFYSIRLIIDINNSLSTSFINSKSGEFSIALGIPLPTPTKGRMYLALVNNIGFRGIEVPILILSIVRVLGSFPGLIISTLLSNMKTLILDKIK